MKASLYLLFLARAFPFSSKVSLLVGASLSRDCLAFSHLHLRLGVISIDLCQILICSCRVEPFLSPLLQYCAMSHRPVAVCCSVLQCVAVCCSVLQCVAVCCSVLQCVAVCCSVLQCVAVRVGAYLSRKSFFCSHLYLRLIIILFPRTQTHTLTHTHTHTHTDLLGVPL